MANVVNTGTDSKYTFEWYGEQIAKESEIAAAKAIQMCALDLQGEAAEEAPVDSGDLRGNASATFERQIIKPAGNGENVEVSTEALTARVGFTLPYALIQHENLQFNHPMGGKAKYLEDPLNRKRAKYEKYISGKVGEVFKRNVADAGKVHDE